MSFERLLDNLRLPINVREVPAWALLNLMKSALVFFAAWIVVRISLFILDRVFRAPEENAGIGINSEIADLMRAIFRIIVVYGVYFAAGLISLQFFGLDVVATFNLVAATGTILKIVMIVVISRMVVKIGRRIIEQVFTKSAETNLFGEEKRLKTIKALLKSVIMYVVYFIAFIMVLGTAGVNTTSIIASAGILGLAVGFGAQNLVRDIITGFFIIFENQFSVGEYINTAGVSGIVEEMGLRTTKIRDWSGELHIIPNGEVTKVTNHNRGKMRALVEVGIAYEEDIDRAIKVLQQASDEIKRMFGEKIIDGPTVQGVQNLGPSEVVIRTVAYTQPMEQFAVERELRKALKHALNNAGIEIPYPRRVVITDKGGLKDV